MTRALELQPALSDGELATAAAAGDRQAFAEIYDRYADRLYDFCVGLIGDRDAAADCVQDAFCVAATDLASLREPDRLRPWLYSITRHHAMRRLRHRYREEVSDDLPDMASSDASPETLAGQSELARLVADAAGGLSDRDRELLELSYRHGLDGPELAEALGVTLTNANTLMFRLRQTVERSLGALLVARGAHANPDACPALATILKGWDGQFTVLLRKRTARHIESCPACAEDQRRSVNPVSLLGGAAVFIPAPAGLRQLTLDRVQLTSAASELTPSESSSESSPIPSGPSGSSGTVAASGMDSGSKKSGVRLALVAAIPLALLILAIAWFARPADPVSRPGETVPFVDTGAESSQPPPAVIPGTAKRPTIPGQEQPVPIAGPSQPTRQAQTARGGNAPSAEPKANTPGPAPGGNAPGPAPMAVPPNPGAVAPAASPADAPAPNPIPAGASNPPDGAPPVPIPDPAGTPKSPQGSTVVTDTGPLGPPVTTGTPGGTTGSTLGVLPNPNLNPKIVSLSPQQPNTATITNPNTKLPNLQIGTSPKTITAPQTGSGTITNTNPNAKTPSLQTSGTPKLSTNGGTAPAPNPTNPKTTKSTSK